MSKSTLKQMLQIKNSTDTSAELYFYGDIVSDWWGAWQEEDQYPLLVKEFLDDVKGKDLNIYINSGGGSVFAGMAIYNMIKRHNGKKTVYVDGLAGSIASVIAMAGDKIIIPSNAFLMIHKPWSGMYGNSTELRKMADDLDRIEEGILNVYADNLKDGVDIEVIRTMVNEETWLTGSDATKYFNIEITENNSMVACASDCFKNYSNIPEQLKNSKPCEDKNKCEIDKFIKELEVFTTLEN